MGRQPELYTAETIRKWNVGADRGNGRWTPARPIGHTLYPWTWRWKYAWRVLTGKYDALQWDDK